MSDYEIKNLREVEDMAVKHGFSEMQEARFPRSDLGAETTGLAYTSFARARRRLGDGAGLLGRLSGPAPSPS